jgi:hypothetical protein
VFFPPQMIIQNCIISQRMESRENEEIAEKMCATHGNEMIPVLTFLKV